jgi:predicted Zn-dependent protease
VTLVQNIGSRRSAAGQGRAGPEYSGRFNLPHNTAVAALEVRVTAPLKNSCRIALLSVAVFACTTPTFAQVSNVKSTTKQLRARHVADKDNIDAIGSRNLGKTGAGNWYSLEQEQKMGRLYAQVIEHDSKLVSDALVTEYVNRISQNIVRNSDARVPFTVKVVQSDDINAFALPGGYLYVNTGLILAVQDEAELAGVMAHEIAHVAARHATRQMTRSSMFNLASLPLVFVGGPLGAVLQSTMGFAKPLGLTKFSRGFEAEADYLGVQYLYKAGYDPQALVSFFERIGALEKHNGIISRGFSRHPQTSDRVKKLQKELTTILPVRDLYVVSTSEFDEVVARLLQSGNSVLPVTEVPRPILRRVESTTTEVKCVPMASR